MYLDAIERGHTHIEEDSIEHRHGDELQRETRLCLIVYTHNLRESNGPVVTALGC